jgi:hypothetical protein
MRFQLSAFGAVVFCAATSVASFRPPLNARDAFLRSKEAAAHAPQQHEVRGPTVLKPIHPSVFDSAVGIGGRDIVEFDSLPPATQAQMVFGSPGSKLLPPPYARRPRLAHNSFQAMDKYIWQI